MSASTRAGTRTKWLKDYEDAAGLGMKGTPVFFVNGRALLGAHPFATFQKAIEAELQPVGARQSALFTSAQFTTFHHAAM